MYNRTLIGVYIILGLLIILELIVVYLIIGLVLIDFFKINLPLIEKYYHGLCPYEFYFFTDFFKDNDTKRNKT